MLKNQMKQNQIIAALVLVNLLLAVLNAWNRPKQDTVFVLTPMIDIWPSATPLSLEEKEHLQQEFSFQPESRGLGQIYSHMGATLSFHDLLRGVQFLEKSKTPLSGAQKKDIFQKIRAMQNDHKRLLVIQKQLLENEKRLIDLIDKLEQE